MIAGIHISLGRLEADVLKALKFSLENRLKHALRLLQLYGERLNKSHPFETKMTEFSRLFLMITYWCANKLKGNFYIM